MDQVGKEFHHVIDEVVGKGVHHSRCVLNLVIEVSVLESKGDDGGPSYSKSPDYLGGVHQCHDSDLAHGPLAIEIICTVFEEHEVGASPLRQTNPTSANYFTVPNFDS